MIAGGTRQAQRN